MTTNVSVAEMFRRMEPVRVATINARQRLAVNVSTCSSKKPGPTVDVVVVVYRKTGSSIIVPVSGRQNLSMDDAVTALNEITESEIAMSVQHAYDAETARPKIRSADCGLLIDLLNELDMRPNQRSAWIDPHTAKAMITCCVSAERAAEIVDISGIDWSEDDEVTIKASLWAAHRALPYGAKVQK